MAPKMKPFIRAEKHLILTAPDTEFENFLSELDQLSEREPEILDKIEQDLEKYARNKKKERLEDKRWQEARNPWLPLIEMMNEDISNLQRVIIYCHQRVFEEKKVPSTEKVLSLSDQSSAYIQKGDREALIGYKPQLGRSGNGFISVLITPEGNAADSGQLDPALVEHLRCTITIPSEVSLDDGYANQAIREKWMGKGVKVFSISGAKGKKMTPIEEWESEIYLESRNGRSAAESLMFHLKHRFHFGQVMRRGIENVRAELLEKALTYNFCKMIELKKRQLKQAA